MQGKTPVEDLAPQNLEIEAACRRNNTARRRRELQEGPTDQGDKGIPSSESSFFIPSQLGGASVVYLSGNYHDRRQTAEGDP